MKKPANILIVEDEESIRSGLMDVFVFHGFTAEGCDNGHDGLNKSLSGKFDLVVLDIMLPGMDGFEVCNNIRDHDRHLPIIMLTAKNSDEDIIQGLKLGADDYVSKPFSVTELLLRVEAILRRSGSTNEPAERLVLNEHIEVDLQNLTGQFGDRTVSFTKKEMDVLRYLAENTERPVSREELLCRVWGYAVNSDIETRTVDIHIAKLRRKIEINPKSPRLIVTVRNAGYRLSIHA